MSVTGKIKNGVVVLPPGTKLPEGADVKIETLELAPEDDPFVAAFSRWPSRARIGRKISSSTTATTSAASQKNRERRFR